jgi:nucleoside-diphosphate-sugar epimerase
MTGRLLILGAGGKMGPSLCVRARRAVEAAGSELAIVAVSRFSDEQARGALEQHGIETVACDLMEPDAVENLPDADNVIFLVGWKFGTSDNPGRTWAVNSLTPSLVSRRYPDSRIVALSSGNVYPFRRPADGGSTEADPVGPVGEYAWSCLARERVFEHWSITNETPMVLVRLNYAVELRYGVLVDIALKIRDGLPVDLTTGYLNCIWQGDANDIVIRALSLAENPPRILNLTGPRIHDVRGLATRIAARMEKPVVFSGEESETALLNDASFALSTFGSPVVDLRTVARWTADWVSSGGAMLDKPTHFQVRDGKF